VRELAEVRLPVAQALRVGPDVAQRHELPPDQREPLQAAGHDADQVERATEDEVVERGGGHRGHRHERIRTAAAAQLLVDLDVVVALRRQRGGRPRGAAGRDRHDAEPGQECDGAQVNHQRRAPAHTAGQPDAGHRDQRHAGGHPHDRPAWPWRAHGRDDADAEGERGDRRGDEQGLAPPRRAGAEHAGRIGDQHPADEPQRRGDHQRVEEVAQRPGKGRRGARQQQEAEQLKPAAQRDAERQQAAHRGHVVVEVQRVLPQRHPGGDATGGGQDAHRGPRREQPMGTAGRASACSRRNGQQHDTCQREHHACRRDGRHHRGEGHETMLPDIPGPWGTACATHYVLARRA
jgi:hypothetical protein